MVQIEYRDDTLTLATLLLIRGAKGDKPMKVFATPAGASDWISPLIAAEDATWTTERLTAIRAAIVEDHDATAA